MIIIDDFIRDQTLLDAAAVSDEFESPDGHWWEGWWKAPAVTLRQRLIHEIWAEHCPHPDTAALLQQAAGFEHWVGRTAADGERNAYLRAHRDRDELLFEDTGEHRHPLIGCVFYPRQDEFEGGYLKIFNEDREDGPYELIAPRFNRLVIFDASILHGTTPVTAGLRYALAINVWATPIHCVTTGRLAVNG